MMWPMSYEKIACCMLKRLHMAVLSFLRDSCRKSSQASSEICRTDVFIKSDFKWKSLSIKHRPGPTYGGSNRK